MIDGNNIKHLRKRCNMTILELAKEMSVNSRTIERWENNDTEPTSDDIIKLCDIFGVDTRDLYEDQNYQRSDDKPNGFYEFYRRFPYPIVIVAVYLFLGFNNGLWHPAWLLFLTIPLYYTIDCFFIPKKSNKAFAFPVLITLIYLYLGCVNEIWHPTWLLFFTIPVYYSVVR